MAPIDTLIAGYRRFRDGEYQDQRRRFDSLATQGQAPKTMIVACCDSRVDPTRVFDVDPGEIFVLRNVANLVPPYELDNAQHSASAAIEFAVTQLEVTEIMVLGHAQCGGISASLTGRFDGAKAGEGHFIDRWMSMIDPARTAALEAAKVHPDVNPQQVLELAAIRFSLDNLRSFPFVAERVADGRLVLRGAFFSIADGILKLLNPETDHFEPVPL
jgi:carbonic anhydrase